MASEPTIDVSRLLQPLDGEVPAGEELSVADPGSPLLKVKDAWDEARKLVKEELDKERSGGIDSQGQTWRVIPDPDWAGLIAQCEDILANRSKDFRVAAWLTEGLLRRHGARGLRDGLEVCAGLCRDYWDNIRPIPDDDDGHGAVVGPFSGLMSEASVAALSGIVLVTGTKPGERSVRSYTVLDHQRGKELESVSDSDERERLIEAGHVTSAEFQAVAAVTEPEFFGNTLEDLAASIELLEELDQFLRSNCRDDQYGEPTWGGMSAFREKLVSIQRLVKELRGEDPVAGEGGESGDHDSGGSGTGNASVMTRETAFQNIERIALFFERTEPHSPVPFVLRQAIRWGRLSLPDLWNELIDNSNEMDRIRKMIGLPQPPEN